MVKKKTKKNKKTKIRAAKKPDFQKMWKTIKDEIIQIRVDGGYTIVHPRTEEEEGAFCSMANYLLHKMNKMDETYLCGCCGQYVYEDEDG